MYKIPSFLAFYVSFVVTPICSNASELVSSLLFAAKKKKENVSMTFSQVKEIFNDTEAMHDLLEFCFN